jgi:hypothetical protein
VPPSAVVASVDFVLVSGDIVVAAIDGRCVAMNRVIMAFGLITIALDFGGVAHSGILIALHGVVSAFECVAVSFDGVVGSLGLSVVAAVDSCVNSLRRVIVTCDVDTDTGDLVLVACNIQARPCGAVLRPRNVIIPHRRGSRGLGCGARGCCLCGWRYQFRKN